MARTRKITTQRTRRTNRIRSTIIGTRLRPRLSVFRSNLHIDAQIIDDENGKTLCAVHDREVKVSAEKGDMSPRIQRAFLAGKLIAEKAAKLKITSVVFDRRGAKYHGRIAAFAKGAREGGLTF